MNDESIDRATALIKSHLIDENRKRAECFQSPIYARTILFDNNVPREEEQKIAKLKKERKEFEGINKYI